MTPIHVVTEESSRLDEVRRLWRANSETLGFLPDGAFLERAQKGQILVAEDGGSVAGYVLYYIEKKRAKVRVTHLCVGQQFRGKGIAKQLIDALRKRTKSCWGIGLHCRRDYDAWKLWPKLGFHAISEKIGQSKDGHELTFFWLAHPHRELFSLTKDGDDDRLTVVIDANVFYDLDDPTRNGADETQGLIADWLQPSIQLCITQELSNEIIRNPDPDARKRRMVEAKKFASLECDTDAFHAANDLVKRLLGKAVSEQDQSDQRHLARAIASKAEVFVTRDSLLLEKSDDIYSQHGLSVVRPAQLVARFEELRNERDYQRDRLVGTSIQTRRASNDAECLAEAFRLPDEKRWEFAGLLNRVFAHPQQYRCQYISASGGKPLALYVLEESSSSLLSISVFRLSRSVMQTRLAGTLARTLLTDIVQSAVRQDKKVICLTAPNLDSILVDALRDRGFIQCNHRWIKISIRGVVPYAQVNQRIREVIQAAGIQESALSDLLVAMGDESFSAVAEDVLQIEHMLWPGKVAGCDVPNYVIPIRPNWAVDLFDAGLAKSRLWGADTELALNPDSVYYRAIRPRVLRDRGRILWYVSDDSNQGSKRIRACSQMTDVVTGQPKEIFRRFRRFGVFEWRNVLDVAGSKDGQVMAVQFTDTELFDHPVDWRSLQSILLRHEKNLHFHPQSLLRKCCSLIFTVRALETSPNQKGLCHATAIHPTELRRQDISGGKASRVAKTPPSHSARGLDRRLFYDTTANVNRAHSG